MSSLSLDLRPALRGLGRRPAFAIVAILTLGIAAGAATAVYSVVDAALLAPLPYSDPGRLLRIYERDLAEGRPLRPGHDRGLPRLARLRAHAVGPGRGPGRDRHADGSR